MKKQIYSIVLCCLALTVFSQRFIEPEDIKAFNITVNYPDYTVKTQMLKTPKKISAQAEQTYHWYTNQTIMETKGGFDGKLLHGYYRSFYLSNQLFESGEFKYGVKTGTWKNWYPDGKLKEQIQWKNGQKNGAYFLYNSDGSLVGEGRFKNDVLTSKFKTYDKNKKVILVQRYKKGELVIPKEKKNVSTHSTTDSESKTKEKKFRLFKKKPASTNNTKKNSVTKKDKKTTQSKDKKFHLFKQKNKSKQPSTTIEPTSINT